MSNPILAIDNLTVAFPPYDVDRRVLRDASLTVQQGTCLGVIGESGSGKSTIALSVLRSLAKGGRYLSGTINFKGQNLLDLSDRQMRSIYGRGIAHVAQDPMGSLNPSLKIGTQLTEAMALHLGLDQKAQRDRALALLREVRLRNPEGILQSYPHQLSGGMQQRVCIAMALSCDPSLLILDEPTTGLDAVTEAAILGLLSELKVSRNISIIFISHNLSAVAGLADNLAIMYGGMVVETGPASEIFARPAHRYTHMLLAAAPTLKDRNRALQEIPWQESTLPREGCPFTPRCDIKIPKCTITAPKQELGASRMSRCVRWEIAAVPAEGERAIDQLLPRGAANGPVVAATAQAADTVLEIGNLSHVYGRKKRARGAPKAVNDVSFDIRPGEVVGVIGESGSGKSTLARSIVGLVQPSEGRVMLRGENIARFSRYPLRVTRQIQIVFQNIAGSLHPRKTLARILSRPAELYERRRPDREELQTLIASVGLKPHLLEKRSNRLSGGERQRAALARAYAPNPSLIILDEAFSALDASMKVRVARLVGDKKSELNTSFIFVTHDLPFVPYIADRVIVMYQGWACESGKSEDVLQPPHHPYTETLIWSALELEGERPRSLKLISEEQPRSGTGSQGGCPYASRCPRKLGAICDEVFPPTQIFPGNHRVGCHIPAEALEALQVAEFQHNISGVESAVS